MKEEEDRGSGRGVDGVNGDVGVGVGVGVNVGMKFFCFPLFAAATVRSTFVSVLHGTSNILLSCQLFCE